MSWRSARAPHFDDSEDTATEDEEESRSRSLQCFCAGAAFAGVLVLCVSIAGFKNSDQQVLLHAARQNGVIYSDIDLSRGDLRQGDRLDDAVARKEGGTTMTTTDFYVPGSSRKPAGCHTALEGESCYDAVEWARSAGIHGNPEWYPGLTPQSTFEDFQESLSKSDRFKCPIPCPQISGEAASAKNCRTAHQGEKCYIGVQWAQSEGIYSHPDWYLGLSPQSSFDEFQMVLSKDPASQCPPPCKLQYTLTRHTVWRSTPMPIIKGIAYGPSPEMEKGVLLPNDDFTNTDAGGLWASWGRNDIRTMRQLGANSVRLYGNDPRINKKQFLDEAFKQGLDVLVGMSDYPYLQADDSCSKNDFDCFSNIYESYKQNLNNGLTVTIGGHKAYHPAVKVVLVINEPELKFHHSSGDCKAVITAFDAMLQAEKDLGIVGNPPAFTVAYSLASKYGRGATGSMAHLYKCMVWPKYYIGEDPQNDVTTAYKTRWINSFNTPQTASETLKILSRYGRIEPWTRMKIPIFIGEYHSPSGNEVADLPEMFSKVGDRWYPYFMGYFFFEFQSRYDKKDNAEFERKFGMYGLERSCRMGDFDFFGKTYTVRGLFPRGDLEKAVADTFGGRTVSHQCKRIESLKQSEGGKDEGAPDEDRGGFDGSDRPIPAPEDEGGADEEEEDPKTPSPTPRPPAPRPPAPRPRPASGQCKDKNQFCPDWAAKGECNKNPRYMQLKCQKSCKICEETQQVAV